MVRWREREEAEPLAPRAPDERRALRDLVAIWHQADALLGAFFCPKSGECCRFATTRREPYLLPLERLALEKALRRQGRALPKRRPDGACALLDSTGLRCSIYADRPFGCRTFFCAKGSGKPAPNSALHELSAKLTRLSDSIVPEGEPWPISRLFGE
jgi:uncharacterized protein